MYSGLKSLSVYFTKLIFIFYRINPCLDCLFLIEILYNKGRISEELEGEKFGII